MLLGKHMFSFRRLLGIIIGAVPFIVVLFCSFSEWRLNFGMLTVFGYCLFGFGGFISIGNFYFSFLRYPIHRLRHGKDAKYQWVSGIPLMGILSVVGLIHLPKSLWLNVLAFLFLCIDTGGIQWFVICTWKADSMWNPKKHDREKNDSRE